MASIVDVLVKVNSPRGRTWSYPRPGVDDRGVTRFGRGGKARTSAELRARLAAKWAIGDDEAATSAQASG